MTVGRPLLLTLVSLMLIVVGAGKTRADESAAAFPVPSVAGVAHPFWLVASDFTPDELVTITLTAPFGQTCAAVDMQTGETAFIVDDLGVVQATVDPVACAAASGVWIATFQAVSGHQALAGFSVHGLSGASPPTSK